ncbi:MAG: 30S ribosomal protein S17 [Fidelibacterota bacterium]
MASLQKGQTLVGTVLSNRMEKTVVVEVSRRIFHPVYKKYVVRRKKYKAHDENQRCRPGDRARIVASRPLSKTKRWRVVEVISKGAGG